MAESENTDLIEFIKKKKHEVLACIFTKDDADAFLNDGDTLTNDQWSSIVRNLGKYWPSDADWEMLHLAVQEETKEEG